MTRSSYGNLVLPTLILIAVTAGLLLAYFGVNPSLRNVEIQTTASVVEYGNGVYYFGATRAEFGNALSGFVGSHPELEVVTVAGDGTGSSRFHWGYFDRGYFVVTRERVQAE